MQEYFQCLCLAGTSLSNEEINRVLDKLGPLMDSMTLQEGKDQVLLGRKLMKHRLMKAMIRACVVSTDEENRILDVMEKYHENQDPEFRKNLQPEIDKAISGLRVAKENFATAIGDLSHCPARWSAGCLWGLFCVFGIEPEPVLRHGQGHCESDCQGHPVCPKGFQRWPGAPSDFGNQR